MAYGPECFVEENSWHVFWPSRTFLEPFMVCPKNVIIQIFAPKVYDKRITKERMLYFLYRVVIKFGDIRACTVLRICRPWEISSAQYRPSQGIWRCQSTDVANFNYHPVYVVFLLNKSISINESINKIVLQYTRALPLIKWSTNMLLKILTDDVYNSGHGAGRVTENTPDPLEDLILAATLQKRLINDMHV